MNIQFSKSVDGITELIFYRDQLAEMEDHVARHKEHYPLANFKNDN